jgi:hypothetical protein
MVHYLVCNAPEADVARSGINRLRMAHGGSVATTIIRRAQMRTALDDLAGNPDLRLVICAALEQ